MYRSSSLAALILFIYIDAIQSFLSLVGKNRAIISPVGMEGSRLTSENGCQMKERSCISSSSRLNSRISRRTTMLMGSASAKDDNDDDDDDDDYIDDSALGDWRTFRSTLVGNGLSSESSTNEKQEEKKESQKEGVGGKEDTADAISPNVELLFAQSDQLAEEYLSGAWAHESPGVEIGGLVVRLPLEAEIYKNGEKTAIGKKLMRRMDVEEVGSSGSSYLSLGSSDDDSSASNNLNLSFSLVAAQTLLWYKKAQKLIEEEMLNVANLANERGEIDPMKLDEESKSLLNLYLDNQNSWQEVCLIAERNASEGTSTVFVLNRPMAFSVTKSLARLVLFGALDASLPDRLTPSQSKQLVLFLKAFENMCAVYVGGPDNMDAPAVMLHGYGDIEGAEEIAPGTKVYKGGIDGAIEGILSGKYSPLDFRFFVGRYNYKNGDLDVAVNANKYQTIACARPIILKQCIQLPKPLWHEVLELCGGELMEMSKLELMKRDDLKN